MAKGANQVTRCPTTVPHVSSQSNVLMIIITQPCTAVTFVTNTCVTAFMALILKRHLVMGRMTHLFWTTCLLCYQIRMGAGTDISTSGEPFYHQSVWHVEKKAEIMFWISAGNLNQYFFSFP